MLAWEIAGFLEPVLSQTEQQALAIARSAAFAQLVRERDCGLSYREAERIGWPASDVAAQLLSQLQNALEIA